MEQDSERQKLWEQICPSEEERTRLTWEAIASVQAGNTYPHEQIVEWAKSLKEGELLPLPIP